jgi:hypothetical protein
MEGRSEEEVKKIREIMQKSAIDLCYAIVPEVEQFVSDRGVFQASTPEKELVLRAFFTEQRKAFFALANGVIVLKNGFDRLEAERVAQKAEFTQELENLKKRMNMILKMGNTGALNHLGTTVEKK